MDIDYETVRSARTTFGLFVERDRRVVVRAPDAATDEEVARFVGRKKLWLYQKLRGEQKYDPERQGAKPAVSGTSMLYLGQTYPLDVVDEPVRGLRFDGRFVVQRSTPARTAALVRSWYRDRAREVVVPLVEAMADRLGVAYQRVSIVDLQYRWGSCTEAGALLFNWRLVQAPLLVVKYVVAHELAHIIEPNHSAAFWQVVGVQAPHHERARQWLREHGDELEATVGDPARVSEPAGDWLTS